MSFDLTTGEWLFPAKQHQILADRLELTTDPHTDFWQRSYYGFRNDNAPALLFERSDNFSFTVKVNFDYQTRFDQCGVLIYLDSDNWFKASIEYENAQFSRLGSVVTNLGYSDWATQDIETPKQIWYRLSRRGPDFLIESSVDGDTFQQMRIFHLHALGETTQAMGQAEPPMPAENAIRFGLYACSPMDSRFNAVFTEASLGPCRWKAHGQD